MNRNMKVFGLALLAVLAMSAVAASAASATAFDAPSGLTKITASQENAFEHTISVEFGIINCEKATFFGEVTGNGLASVELAPTYTKCKFAGSTATFSTNGCNLTLFPGGTGGFRCPVGNEMTVVAPELGTVKCTVHIPEQNGLKGVTYTNLGVSPTKEVTFSLNLTGIKYSQTEGSGLGKCPTVDNKLTGAYTGNTLATGENAAGSAHTDFIWTA